MIVTARPRPAPDVRGRERDAHLDNAKAVLIALVATGHTLGQTLGSYPGAATLYTWIYLFHMPAFVLLSGLLTSDRALDGPRCQAMIRTLVVPYLLFQVLYACYFEFSGRDQDWGLDHLLTPLYHLWFLPALFLWRMLAPLLRRLRFAMAGAVALSLATGTMTAFGPALAVNRVMALLPFFVFGMLYGTRTVRWLASIPFVKIAAAVTLTVGLVAAAVVHAELPVPWLYWTASYEALHVDLVHGMAIRAGLLCLALVLACALLALVPRGHSALTGIGRRSMCPYLFHAFVTLAFAWSTYRPTRWWEIACLCAGAVALTALLGSRWVSRALRMLVDPQLAWLFRRDDRSAGLPGTASVDTGTDHGGVGAGRRDVGSIPVGSGGPHRDRVAGAVDGTFGSSAIGRRPSRVAAMAES